MGLILDNASIVITVGPAWTAQDPSDIVFAAGSEFQATCQRFELTDSVQKTDTRGAGIRPAHEQLAEVQEASAAGLASCTFTFGPRRSCPRVTTRSPFARPCSMMARSLSVRCTRTRRTSAVRSSLTT